MSFTNTFLVEIDGTALPADIAPLLIAALVDDSQQYPDLFELRFRDPAHLVLPKSGAKVGSAVKISVSTERQQGAAAADDRRDHRAPVRVRLRRARSPCCAATTRRTACSAAGVPRPTRR